MKSRVNKNKQSQQQNLALMPLSVLAMSLCMMGQAQAQSSNIENKTESKTESKTASSVVISGQRSSMRKSLELQEKANNIVSAVSSDDIGALPDKNAAEALSRLPGVSVQRDQGEGRYVSVRGIGPDLNTVTINGATIPSPEAGRRGVALDVLPSGLIRTLEVIKTLRPDMDANSLGATIEVKSLSAFDLPKAVLSGNIASSRDQNIGKNSPAMAALWADRFAQGTLGVAMGLNIEKREFGSDNVETGSAWSNGRVGGFELRDYLPTRERKAFAVNLDYRPSPQQSYFVRSLVSRFSDDEVRDRLTVSNVAGGALSEGVPATARLERRLRARKYTQEITSNIIGAEHQVEAWKLAASAGKSRATYDLPNALNDARFRGNANFAGVGFTNSMQPNLVAPASAFDPASYSLNAITFQSRWSADAEKHAKFDITRQYEMGSIDADLQFGLKQSRRNKNSDTDQFGFSSSSSSPNFWGAGPTSMSSFVNGTVAYRLGQIGAALDPNLLRARVANANWAAAKNVSESLLNDFNMNENIQAAYVQNNLNADKWNLLMGVRLEKTEFDASGNKLSAGSTVQSVQAKRDYQDWLPNVQARYDMTQQTSIRAAFTKAVVRANFSQLAPGVNLVSNTEAVIGNPDLLPLKANNLDLGIEHLLPHDGSISAYVFHKKIANFTYTTNLAGTGNWLNHTSAISYANGDEAKVRGLELSYNQSLRMLPAPLNRLIMGVNASVISSSAQVARFDKTSNARLSRSIPLPGQSDRVANIMLGYEHGPISSRIALNFKSPYLLDMGSDILRADTDTYVDQQKQVDFSFAYQVTPKIQMSFEVNNLNKEVYYVYQGTRALNAQYEQYGRTYKVSLKMNLF